MEGLGKVTVSVIVEGRTDVAIARKLLGSAGLVVEAVSVCNGKRNLDLRVPRLNSSSRNRSWLILRDLDRDAPCAPALIQKLLGKQTLARRVNFRIAERAIESWLLADHDAFLRSFYVQKKDLPPWPDELDNPKISLVNICRRSRDRDVREAIVPLKGTNQPVGIDYVTMITRFVEETWNPERAADRSPSLDRALKRIRAMKAEGRWT